MSFAKYILLATCLFTSSSALRFQWAESIANESKLQQDGPDLDLDVCAAEFPAYLTYLNRQMDTFKSQMQADHSYSDKEQQQIFERPFALEIIPGSKVPMRLHRSSGAPCSVALMVIPGHGVDVQPVKHDNISHTDSGFGGKAVALRVLKNTIARHGEILRADLEGLGGMVGFHGVCGDYPSSNFESLDTNSIPMHSFYSNLDNHWSSIAMPDNTFDPSQWESVSKTLFSTEKTRTGFMYRGRHSGGRGAIIKKLSEGPPAEMAPLLNSVIPDGFNVSLTSDDGLDRLTQEEMCKWPFTFHMDGVTASLGLKYKLACGQTVFMVESPWKEFWYDALQNGTNVFLIKPDMSNLWSMMEYAFSPGSDPTNAPPDMKATKVAKAGQNLARTYLSQHGIDCYVMLYLKRFYLPFMKSYLQKRSS